MAIKCQLRHKRRYFRGAIKGIFGLIFAVYFVIPLTVYLFPSIPPSLIFLHWVRRPKDLTRPDLLEMPLTRNFYIQRETDDLMLGAWHILPQSLTAVEKPLPLGKYEEQLSDDLPIVIYYHGNAGSRATQHRRELYQVLRQLDAHVIAVDYRGYADSSYVYPTEDNLVDDAKVVYKWVKKRAGNSRVFIWGHSLGTGVATRAVKELNKEGEFPAGLILEAPFNNMSEEILHHPLTFMLQIIPWFKWATHRSLEMYNAQFDSDKHIIDVTIPIVIFHAEDDFIIPFRLGYKLYEAAVKNERKSPVNFIRFDSVQRLNHQHICRAQNLPHIVSRFLDNPEKKLS
ncbi:hypothetical protein CHUAL_009728 [Chamberlinius hualienensis]